MGALAACSSVHRLSEQYTQRPEEGVRSLETGVIDSCEETVGAKN